MTNLTKILIGAGVVGGAVITPVIYTSQIDKFIKQEKINLQKQQIEVKETKNNDDFFNVKREYIVTIKDITSLLQNYQNINDYYFLENAKEIFNNTKFLVKLNILKFPVYHKDAITIDLYSLNNNITKELSTDKIGSQILEAIKNRVFEAMLDINNLKISKARLKDINLNLKSEDEYSKGNGKIEVLKAIANIENNNFKIAKIAINSEMTDKETHHKNITKLSINKINEKIKQQNLLNYSSILKIASINFIQKSEYKNIQLNINNITNLSSIKTITNKTSLNNKIEIKTFTLNQNRDLIKIDNFKYNLNISNLDTPSLKKIIELENSNNIADNELLLKNIEKIIQRGFKVSIYPLSVKKIEAQFFNQKYDIKPIEINLEAKISPNNYTLNNGPQALLTFINAKLKATTYKENIDLLNQQNPQIALMINMLKKEVNNKIFINLEYQKGKLTSNGKPIF
jgi:hypothetical protein